MLDSLASDIRIWRRAGGAPVGVGFIVGTAHVVTCAHVVADALGARALAQAPNAPVDEVELDFPQLATKYSQVRRRAIVKVWKPLGALELDDVAVLSLSHPLPEGTQSIHTGADPRIGDCVRAYGVRAGLPDGAYVQGTFQGVLPGPRLQITSDQPDLSLRGGCSGGAAWNVTQSGVVGMVTAAIQDLSGLLLPIGLVVDLCRVELGIEIPAVSVPPLETGSAGTVSVRLIDLFFDQELTDNESLVLVRKFPLGPAVDGFKVGLDIKRVFAQRLDLLQSLDVVGRASELVLNSLDLKPARPHTFVISQIDLPNPNSRMLDWWAHVFNHACMLGPRMLAGLFIVAGPRVVNDSKNKITTLLNDLRDDE